MKLHEAASEQGQLSGFGYSDMRYLTAARLYSLMFPSSASDRDPHTIREEGEEGRFAIIMHTKKKCTYW
jgi:hypothetical protein